MAVRVQELDHVSEQEFEAWRLFLRAHAAITRRLDSRLSCTHQLTLSQYEVLFRLAKAPGRKMRMSELAESVLLTRSGVSRLVGALEQAGMVRRASCSADGRGAFALLTPAGDEKLREAAGTHMDGVRELYLRRFSKSELDRLADLLAVLPGAAA
jgi:DNA-binding MarR family transcriptional regulator